MGVVCNAKAYRGGIDLNDYLEENYKSNPRLQSYMENAERVAEISVISNYSFHCKQFAGDRWMLIGDSAIFLDPIFSSGVHVSVMSAKIATDILVECLNDKSLLTDQKRNERYQAELEKGAHRFHKLISMFYFENFVHQMKKTLERPRLREMFTSAVAGDMWNDQNFLFEKNVL